MAIIELTTAMTEAEERATQNSNNGFLNSSKANTVQESWYAPVLQNGWVNYGIGYKNAGYIKDSLGFVHLTGLIKDGTTTPLTVLFTLPAGYRPSYILIFSIVGGRVDIYTNGNVVVNPSTASFISFDGISFKAEL